jgi:hypothetical protein
VAWWMLKQVQHDGAFGVGRRSRPLRYPERVSGATAPH